MSKMRAKMVLVGLTAIAPDQESLRFSAVGKNEGYADDGLDENNTFAQFTPSAELNMVITNPALCGKFSEGQTFYVDFTEADSG